MPHSYFIDAEHRLVIHRGWGVITDDESDRHRQSLQADPAFRADYDSLVDYRDAVRMEVKADTPRKAARTPIFDRAARHAIIAPGDLSYGMARLYQAHAENEGLQVCVFRDADSAVEWLGLDPSVMPAPQEEPTAE